MYLRMNSFAKKKGKKKERQASLLCSLYMHGYDVGRKQNSMNIVSHHKTRLGLLLRVHADNTHGLGSVLLRSSLSLRTEKDNRHMRPS